MTAHWIVPRRAARLNAPIFSGPLWKLDRFFDALSLVDRPVCATGNHSFAPAVNIEETDDELRLSAELPGLGEQDFEITTDGDLLTIKGEKKFESTSDDNGRKRIERSCGSFERPCVATSSLPWKILTTVSPTRTWTRLRTSRCGTL